MKSFLMPQADLLRKLFQEEDPKKIHEGATEIVRNFLTRGGELLVDAGVISAVFSIVAFFEARATYFVASKECGRAKEDVAVYEATIRGA